MMITRTFIFGTVALVVLSGLAAAMDTAFSYQGRLNDGGSPAAGDYDFRFDLYTAEIGGSQVGPILYGDDVQVIDGYFTVYLDFGAGVFDGTALWLEVQVRDGASDGSYTPMAPRHAILPSPYSLFSGKVEWSDIAGMPPDFADGVDDGTAYQAGNQLDLAGDTFDVVEGPGSGLDADTLDGSSSSAFADSVHVHSGTHITTGVVAEPRLSSLMARDAEVMSIVLSSDGPGSGLNADLLDGSSASAFEPDFSVGNGLDLLSGSLSVDPTEFNGSTPISDSSTGSASTAGAGVWVNVQSLTISAPAQGHVLVIGTAVIECVTGCTTSTSGTVALGIGENTMDPFDQTVHEFTINGIKQTVTTFHDDVVSNGTEMAYRLKIRQEFIGSWTFSATQGRLYTIFIPD